MHRAFAYLGKRPEFPGLFLPPTTKKRHNIYSIWEISCYELVKREKTYIVSALMTLVSLVHLVTGNLTLVEFISSDHMMSLFEALGLTTLRAGIQKN